MKGKINCKQAVDYISKKEEKKLTSFQRVLLWRHLTICSLCRLFVTQNKIINKAMSGMNSEQELHLSEQEKARIAEMVIKENP